MKYSKNCISLDFPVLGQFPWIPNPIDAKSFTPSIIDRVNLFKRRTMGGIQTELRILLACEFLLLETYTK